MPFGYPRATKEPTQDRAEDTMLTPAKASLLKRQRSEEITLLRKTDRELDCVENNDGERHHHEHAILVDDKMLHDNPSSR